MAGIAIGKLCEKCDGKCIICDSLVNQKKLVHICDECNFGKSQGQCILEKDRDGCPRILNIGGARASLVYEHKKQGGGGGGGGGGG
ncbi:hypothetical protein GGI11_004942, partial [Coemansia sp. RSA 2049]